MSEPARHLALVDPESGEISPEAPSYPDALSLVADLQTVIIKLDNRHKGDLLRIATLEADRDRDALDVPERPMVECLHRLHRAATRADSKTPTRRKALDTHERENTAVCVRKLGFETCVQAVVGITWDPGWSKPRRNGSRECFNTFELCFRTTAKAQAFAERVPNGYQPDPERVAAIAGVEVEWVREVLGQARREAASRSLHGSAGEFRPDPSGKIQTTSQVEGAE